MVSTVSAASPPLHPESLPGAQLGPVGLLLRHAAREPIRSNKETTSAALIPQGRADARAMGALYAEQPIHQVLASPIERCVESGVQFLVGTGMTISAAEAMVKRDRMLANAYINDWPSAKVQFERRDPNQMVLDYTAGEPMSGFWAVAQGVARLLAFVDAQLSSDGLTLLFTHDALIMPVKRLLLGVNYTRDNWLGFLDGVVVQRRRDGLWVDGVRVVQP